MKAYLLTALALASFNITSPSCLAASPRVPIIATGWDSPNTRQFRDGLAAFEAWGVFDGTTLRTSRWSAGGKEQQANMAFSRETWQWSEFAPALADLRAAKPTTCRDNYLMLYSNPGDVDWFDDAGWSAIVDHWRFLARLARQGGLRGLLFDAEPYTPPHSQYRYGAQAATDRIHEEFTRRGLLGSPSMAGYFYSRSVLLMRRGELGGALAMCDSAMNYTVPLQRGQIYRQMAEVYMRARDFEPALEACEEALTISPNAPEILLTLTRVYSAKGDRRMTAEIGGRLLKFWQGADPDYENRREVLRLVGRPGQATPAALVMP